MFFRVLFEALSFSYKSYTDTSGQIKDDIDALKKFLFQYQPSIDYYFGHLYNTVKFVDQHKFIKEFEDKKSYTNLIRAQLSRNELRLLFYNCLSDRGAKFKCLVEKYALLEDMDFEGLLEPEHQSLYSEKAYGGSGLKENQ